jgi:hypothetical protein
MSSLISNNAASVLASSITDSDTTIVLATGDGALFPSPTGSEWFPLTLQGSGTLEILRATARSGDTLTVERAQEGTTALAFSAGDRAELRFTAGVHETYAQGALLIGNNLSDLLDAATSRANLGLAAVAASGLYQDMSGIADSLELKRYNETVAIGSAALDRADGGIQTFTMAADTTFSITIDSGESLTLHLSGGDAYTATWPTITWVGGSEPTLTADDVIQFWKLSTTLYGAYVGSV